MAFKIFELAEIKPPFLIFISFFDLENTKLVINEKWREYSQPFINKSVLLPSQIITDNAVNLDTELKGTFDILWQCVNHPQSPFYDPETKERRE